ncbi:hypothetical protein [Streptomyces cacaoi]|uniref:hypothetical protein n=1 Tax=Streptomyces cacaoi TaxID=1898 RepID=UPI003326C479
MQSTDRFWYVVRELQRAAGRPVHPDSEWETALRAAQGRTPVSARNRFVRLHAPGRDAALEPLPERRYERRVMDTFLSASGPRALSYLCWQADTPVGKTALLADYVRNPPGGTDILNFFVSAAHGTDNRMAFEAEMAEQTEAFLSSPPPGAPAGVRAWRRRFAEAAERSRERGRRLLLVVDGLDDDMGWSEPTSRSGARASAGRGSIAAILPLAPTAGMRVIVTLRRSLRFPDDLPDGHPLRRDETRCALAAVGGTPRTRVGATCRTPLGRTVAELLATAGGGLSAEDLAELAGTSPEAVDRLLQGPEGRCFVIEDPVFRTYGLADPGPVRATPEVGREAVADEQARALLAWSERWRAAGWPEGTPFYLLAHRDRLPAGRAEEDAWVFDPARLRRLASTAGPDTALAQLDRFEKETATSRGSSRALDPGVPLAAARALLCQEMREIPPGAPVLLVRQGEEERARALARSAPTAAARAAHMADVAAEVAGAGRGGASALAQEAARWLSAAKEDVSGTAGVPEAHARVLGAARRLVSLGNPDAARPLLRAVAHDRTAGVSELTAAAGMLTTVEDTGVVAALCSHADALGEGGTRARAEAVELWAELARAVPTFDCHPQHGRCPGHECRPGDHIEAVCDPLGPSDGPGAVDVLALAASELMRLPAPRPGAARRLMRRARDLLDETLADPTVLSEEDRAHLGRELAGTLARFVHAMSCVQPTRGQLLEVERTLSSLPENLRTGELGDDILERARALVEEAEYLRHLEEENARHDKREKERENRKRSEAASQAAKAQAAAYKALRKARRKEADAEAERGALDARRRARAQHLVEEARHKAEEAERAAQAARRRAQEAGRGARPVPRTPGAWSGATRRGAKSQRQAWRRQVVGHGLSSGPHPSEGGPPPRHLQLLHQAYERLADGDLPRSRELLESALHNSPVPSSAPRLSADWTELAQALGSVGAWEEAEALVSGARPEERVRRLAAVSLGCSLTGRVDAAGHYAREAARRVPESAGPGLRNTVACALGGAGDGPGALALVSGNAGERRQAQTAVAAGLAARCPEEAAQLAESLAQALASRIGEAASFRGLPDVAALLLAFPDVRRPGIRVQEALRAASLRAAAPSQHWHAPSMAVLTVLVRLGCLPEEDACMVTSATDRWQRWLRTGQGLCPELALLSAMDGDTAALRRPAGAARSTEERAASLFAAAAFLAGVPVALATDRRADDKAIRICLALLRASGDGVSSGEASAMTIALELLRTGVWARTIPLLPWLAPEALARLSFLARGAGPGPDSAERTVAHPVAG